MPFSLAGSRLAPSWARAERFALGAIPFVRFMGEAVIWISLIVGLVGTWAACASTSVLLNVPHRRISVSFGVDKDPPFGVHATWTGLPPVAPCFWGLEFSPGRRVPLWEPIHLGLSRAWCDTTDDMPESRYLGEGRSTSLDAGPWP